MLAIAMNGDGGATSIADIAEKEAISVAYLEQLLNKLRHDGLVTSVRGAKGGYRLERPASKITVADIVKTLEGNIYPVHCVSDRSKSRGSCKMSTSCVPKLVWVKLARAINDCLESVTLDDLCAESAKLKVSNTHRSLRASPASPLRRQGGTSEAI
jgi:Rrf2 family protein